MFWALKTGAIRQRVETKEKGTCGGGKKLNALF